MPKFKPTDPVIRFFAKVRLPEIENDCWLWQGFLDRGYGHMTINNKPYPAHRWSYEYHKGPVPKELVIDHLCRNPTCVNPDHLEPVTNKENVLRGNSPLAKQAKQTHCIHGHPFDEENTYYAPSRPTRRMCKQCVRDRNLREDAKAQQKDYLSRNKEKIKARRKEYYDKNRAMLIEKARYYHRKKKALTTT